MKDFRDYSLLNHNTFGIDAKCSRFLEFENDDEAIQVAEILRNSKQPYIIIGGGSNLLLTRDFDGIVVRSGIKGMEIEQPTARITPRKKRKSQGLPFSPNQTAKKLPKIPINNVLYQLVRQFERSRIAR